MSLIAVGIGTLKFKLCLVRTHTKFAMDNKKFIEMIHCAGHIRIAKELRSMRLCGRRVLCDMQRKLFMKQTFHQPLFPAFWLKYY